VMLKQKRVTISRNSFSIIRYVPVCISKEKSGGQSINGTRYSLAFWAVLRAQAE
jgi:hypothetical protein